jgi:DNA topoisomerase-1
MVKEPNKKDKKSLSEGKKRKERDDLDSIEEEDAKETRTQKVDATTTKNVKKERLDDSGKPSNEKQLKKLDKSERIAHAMQSFLWWDAKDPPEGCQWSSMEHAGVSFPEPYVPHGVRMKYDGKEVQLNAVEEEA